MLRQVRDLKGPELVEGILRLVEDYRPLHVSLVGGEPLVRHKELSTLLPLVTERGIHVQVVTSAVRQIPEEWSRLRRLNLVVSIDGLQPEHDVRRAPATYDRILTHIQGHRITVHCTITRQMTTRPGYLRDFLEYWSRRPEVRRIWMSIFTPQKGETCAEILPPATRESVINELSHLRREFVKLDAPEGLLDVYRNPPANPSECQFARTTQSITADLKGKISPCQFGGNPDCGQCGCVASAGLKAVARHKLPLGIRVGAIYEISYQIGSRIGTLRGNVRERLRRAKTADPYYPEPSTKGVTD
jgi:MoaA/NifB/PqqE/SkfB family radical SAM enzyme